MEKSALRSVEFLHNFINGSKARLTLKLLKLRNRTFFWCSALVRAAGLANRATIAAAGWRGSACVLVPCNLLAQRVRPWSVLGSSGVRTGVFGSPLPVSSSCEYTKRRRSFVMVSRGWCRSRHTRWAAPSDSDLVSYSVENNHRAAAPHRNY